MNANAFDKACSIQHIVLVCGSLSRGGAERVTVALSDYLFSHGVKVTVVTGTRAENEYDLREGIERIVLSESMPQIQRTRIAYYEGLNHQMSETVRMNNFDVAIVMGVPLLLYAGLSLRKASIPFIVSERNDPAHFNGNSLVRWTSRILMRHASGYVFQTTEAQSYYGLMGSKYAEVIPNPIIDKQIPEPFCGRRTQDIVAVGRLVRQKNHRLLIDAFANSQMCRKGYHLTIYGEGSLRSELQRQVNLAGISDYVSFPGNVSDVLSRIRSASLFVLPSDYEGMPNALMEAMAMGIPCIATDCPCGGPRSLILSEENGILVPVGDLSALQCAIEDVLQNEALSKKIGTNAPSIRSKYNLDHVGSQWFDLIERVAIRQAQGR